MKDLQKKRSIGMLTAEPNDTDLYYLRIRKHLIQILHLVPQLKRINDPVLLPTANLHQTHKSAKCPIAVVLKVNSDLLCVTELVEHGGEVDRGGDPSEGRLGKRFWGNWGLRFEHARRVGDISDLMAVWMWRSKGDVVSHLIEKDKFVEEPAGC